MVDIEQLSETDCYKIIERLREGLPPGKHASVYTVDNQTKSFLDSIKKRHLQPNPEMGKIRFVNGGYGSGKTHLLSLLQQAGLESNYLVSNIELKAQETPFNKFEQVFYKIFGNLISPQMFHTDDTRNSFGFENIVKSALFKNSFDETKPYIEEQDFEDTRDHLMNNSTIDVDFKKVINKYWETYLAQTTEQATLNSTRSDLMQWFQSEGGTVGKYRRLYDVNKMIERSNAARMLNSLAYFARHIGYSGCLILLDESETSYSVMRNSSLNQAHNNLLHLINGIIDSEGLFFVYAVTPDFFDDPKYGVMNANPPLFQRIGAPRDRPPRAIDKVWNLEGIKTSLEDYQNAASKIRTIYIKGESEFDKNSLDEQTLHSEIAQLPNLHGEYSSMDLWRVVITFTISLLDDASDDNTKPPNERYDDVMDNLLNS